MAKKQDFLFLYLFGILELSFATEPSPQPSGANTPAEPKTWSNCQEACKMYQDFKKEADSILLEACGPAPQTPTLQDIPIKNNEITYKNYTECVQDITQKLSETPPEGSPPQEKSDQNTQLRVYCKALEIIDQATDLENASLGVYWAATATCSAACALSFIPVANIAAGYLNPLCTALDLSATAIDIASTVKITQTGESATELIAKMDIASTVLGSTATLTSGAATVTSSHTRNAWTHARQTASRAKEAIQEKLSRSKTAEKLAQTSTQKASQEASEQGAKKIADKILPCAAAALTGAVASIKTAQVVKVIPESKKSVCDSIQKLPAIGSFSKSQVTAQAQNTLTQTPQGQKSGETAQAGQGSFTSPKSEVPLSDQSNSGILAQQSSAVAIEDPLTKPMQEDLQRWAEPRFDAGKKLAAELMQGNPLVNALESSFPDLPSESKNMIQAIDAMAKQGAFQLPGLVSAIPSSGGLGKSETSKNSGLPFFSFQKSMSGSQTSLEMDFKKGSAASKKRETLGSDIWHAQWKGSLFQIISIKINQNQSYVETLEWVTPLNRALMGLPRLQEKKP